jgi:hypothetical protein
MNDLRWTELAAHVVAWHNRNPLARHISVMHVHSLGYVMLPFIDAAGGPAPVSVKPGSADEPLPPEAMAGSLRERAMARARMLADGAAAQADDAPPLPPPPAAVLPAFDEDFFPSHKLVQVRRFALKQAVAQPTPRGDVQVRKVKAQAGVPLAAQLPRWLLTAQVEIGRTKTRVLVGPGPSPAMLGRRLISPGRTVALFALAGVLAGVAGWVTDRAGEVAVASPAASGVAARPAPSAPQAVASATAPELGPLQAHQAASGPVRITHAAAAPTPSAEPGPASSPASSSASPPASWPERPIDVEPRLGKVDLPPIGTRIDERRRVAMAALQASAPASAVTGTVKSGPVAAPVATAPHGLDLAFAVSTRIMRTRSESDQIATAMRELLVNPGGPKIRVEVVPAGDDWRVVGFPYADKALAEKARALLASRGMKVQVVEF